MIENYYYHLDHQNDEFTWNVVETQTNQVIFRHIFEEDAVAMTLNLMNGCGFDGWTPSFFLNP